MSSWLPGCSWQAARGDNVAGVAIAGLLIPEGMAYARIAGVPPQMGLFSALVGMFVYAIFGTSRQLAVTSTSSSAAMLAALVAPLAAVNPARYMLLVSAVTIAAGFLFLLGGVLKLGVVSEFISKPVLKGFVFGLALTIIVKQAHKPWEFRLARETSFTSHGRWVFILFLRAHWVQKCQLCSGSSVARNLKRLAVRFRTPQHGSGRLNSCRHAISKLAEARRG